MKTELIYLAAEKREVVQRVSEVLVAFEKPEFLILFGSYARGDYVDDPLGRDGDGKFPYHSDLDICVIVKSPRQQRRIERSNQLREQLSEASDLRVSFIVHTIRQFNRALENGEYFYVDVVKEGVLLHDAGTSKLSKPKNLSPEERLAKAKEDYEFWTEQADNFLDYFDLAMHKQDVRKAAFFLHQATENYLTVACLVLSGYRPPGHDLVALENWCAQFDTTFKNLLPKETDEERRVLGMLQAAYVGARYKKAFQVERADLETLHRLVLAVQRAVQERAP